MLELCVGVACAHLPVSVIETTARSASNPIYRCRPIPIKYAFQIGRVQSLGDLGQVSCQKWPAASCLPCTPGISPSESK